MGLYNTSDSYGKVTRANHWISAFAFILALATGFLAEEFMGKGPDRNEVFQLHFSLGLSLLALFIIRVIWLKISPNPAPLPATKLETVLGHIVKGFLYLSLIILPVAGYLMVSAKDAADISFFGLFTLPNLIGENETIKDIAKNIHVTFAFFITGVLALHIAGALKHHFIVKDDTLNRMLGKKTDASE